MAEEKDFQNGEPTKPVGDGLKNEAPRWLFDNIAEASKNARQIYFLYLGFLTYCALTIATTSDKRIFLDDQVNLPIINAPVPLKGFFILTPLIALSIFLYLQLYLHRLKSLIIELRTKYRPVNERRLYPWMINIAEASDRGKIGVLQRFTVKFSLWNSLPLVLIYIAFCFVKKHEAIWAYVVGGVPIIGALVSFWFWLNYEPGQWRNEPFSWKIIHSIPIVSIIAFEVFLLGFIIRWAGEGGRHEWIRPYICLDLSQENLVAKPEIVNEKPYWRILRQVHLEGARLTGAILTNADFRQAKIQHADLREAKLQRANLQEAILRNADLRGADLQHSILQGADLEEANFEGANLQHSTLQYAILQGATLREANLKNSIFKEADLRKAWFQLSDLQGANLEGANLDGAILLEAANINRPQIRAARNWPLAQYGPEFLKELGLPANHFENLIKRDFQGYELQEANLQGANLQGANLQKSGLQGANLREADLQNSNLREVELERANLYSANLSKANLQGANLRNASLYNADLSGARLTNVSFQQSDLSNTNLQGADLQGANLEGSNLQGANFKGANLSETDLREARNLTVELLFEVKTLFKAGLDKELKERIMKSHPNLFHEPKSGE